MLAILTTHPIQYQVPLWQELARDGRVPFEVWYLTSHATQASHDPEFGKRFAWDLDMLAGYPHRFLEAAPGARPGSFIACRLTERLRDRLRSAGVRALWIQGWQVAAYWQAVREAKAAGVEVWLRAESNDLAPTPLWKSAIKRVVLGQLFQRVDRFFYIGSANRRLYEKFGVSGDRLYPAPYAVDNERFIRQAKEMEDGRWQIRREWGIPEGAFVVLFCGKFIPKKRPFDVIKAARLLKRSHPELQLHLLFVGSGELGGALRAECDVMFDAEFAQTFASPRPVRPTADTANPSFGGSEVPPSPSYGAAGKGQITDNEEQITNNQKPRASFAGFLNQTEISKAYVAADVLVLPSDYGETWGLVVNEAMASGLPSIVSDRCGCAEDLGVITPNAAYECGNIQELANRVAMLESYHSPVSFKEPLIHYSFSETVFSIAAVLQ
jgi:glycosyltransferase involved in cell wall biosynthesis